MTPDTELHLSSELSKVSDFSGTLKATTKTIHLLLKLRDIQEFKFKKKVSSNSSSNISRQSQKDREPSEFNVRRLILRVCKTKTIVSNDFYSSSNLPSKVIGNCFSFRVESIHESIPAVQLISLLKIRNIY